MGFEYSDTIARSQRQTITGPVASLSITVPGIVPHFGWRNHVELESYVVA